MTRSGQSRFVGHGRAEAVAGGEIAGASVVIALIR
jgi:hypothetical protein